MRRSQGTRPSPGLGFDRQRVALNCAIDLRWTVVVIALTAMGVLGAVSAALLHNRTFIVIANAGKLLRIDDDETSQARR